jgi:hypothetical protein
VRIFVSVVWCGNGVLEVDAIKHDGRVWLVPNWLDHVDEGYMTPERIVGLHAIRHRQLEPPLKDYEVDYLVNETVPEAVLSGEPSNEQVKKYDIQMRPDIRVASSPTLGGKFEAEA